MKALTLAFSLAAATAWAASSTEPSSDAAHYLDRFVDRSADPRNEFNQFAVGKWLKDNPIPANERSWGIGKVVQEETYRRLIGLNQAATAAPAAPGSNAQKIGDFWASAMDSVTVAQQGFAPLEAEFDRIAAIRTRADLISTIGHLKHQGIGALMSMPIFQDEKNSDRYTLHLYQGGLGLPNRDYYVDTDTKGRASGASTSTTCPACSGSSATTPRARA